MDCRLNLWDMRRENLSLTELPTAESSVMSLDGELCALGSADGTITIWRCGTGEVVQRIPAHTEMPAQLEFSRDSRMVFSQISQWMFTDERADATVKAWSVETGELLHSFEPSEKALLIGISDDGHVVCCGDYVVETWEPTTAAQISQITFATERDITRRVKLTPDGSRLVVKVADDEDEHAILTTWNLASGEIVSEFQIDVSFGQFADYAVGDSVLLIDVDGELHVHDLQSGELLQSLTGHPIRISDISVTPDARFAASLGAYEGDLCIWDLESGECIATQLIDDPLLDGNVVSFADDGRSILVNVAGPRAHLFAVENFPARGDEIDDDASE